MPAKTSNKPLFNVEDGEMNLLGRVEAKSSRDALSVWAVERGFASYEDLIADPDMPEWDESTIYTLPNGRPGAVFTNFEIQAYPANKAGQQADIVAKAEAEATAEAKADEPKPPVRYRLDDLQACAPEELPGERDQAESVIISEGLFVWLDDEKDSMGFDRVTLDAPTREGLIAYLLANWGDDEATGGWHSEQVARIEEVEDSDEARAMRGYLRTYSGPWGHMGSSEDALLGMLREVYPDEWGDAGIENLRANAWAVDLAEELYEVECEGSDFDEVVEAILPKIAAHVVGLHLDEAHAADPLGLPEDEAVDSATEAGKQAFLDLVEDEWYKLTKGELSLTAEKDGEQDAALADFVLRMKAEVDEYVATVDAEQTDEHGHEILDRPLPGREVARRIAAAIAILQFGGRV